MWKSAYWQKHSEVSGVITMTNNFRLRVIHKFAACGWPVGGIYRVVLIKDARVILFRDGKLLRQMAIFNLQRIIIL